MNDNGRITCDKKLYVNVNRRFLDVNHLLRALRKRNTISFRLALSTGVSPRFWGGHCQVSVVVIFFFYLINEITLIVYGIILCGLAERSLGHAGPRLSDSWIFQISRDKVEKNFHFTRRATEEELWVAHDAKWTRILENFIFSVERWAFLYLRSIT